MAEPTTIYCFGESLIDFIRVRDPESPPSFRAFVGGAPANAACAAAILGAPVEFVGGLGTDRFADRIRIHLEHNRVSTQHCVTIDRPTALAFVDLDPDGERSFEFRREHTADLLFPDDAVCRVPIGAGDLLHICSNTLCDDRSAAATMALVEHARSRGARVSFDINFRPALWSDPDGAAALIRSCADACDLVKFSSEEAMLLAQDVDELAHTRPTRTEISTRVLVQTDGGGPIDAWVQISGDGGESQVIHQRIEPPSVRAIDTTGAGDAFVGGLLVQLATARLELAELRSDLRIVPWLSWASACGALAVQTSGSSLPPDALDHLPPCPFSP